MNDEIVGLPKEVAKFKNMMPLYWDVPQEIIRMWNNNIEATNSYGSGEIGAFAFKKGRRLSEDSLIYLAVLADSKGRLEMANGFWKLAYEKSKSPGRLPSAKKKEFNSHKTHQYSDPKATKEPLPLREWLFALLRQQGNYSCYSIFLVLPSNKEAIRYLDELSIELKIISNETNSLVVALGSDQHLRSDVDGERWSSTIKGEVQKGYSVKIGRLFGLELTQYPCLVVFKGLNSSEQILITLKNMTADDIAEKMKSIFSIIQRAVDENRSPIEALKRNRNSEQLKNAGKSIVVLIGNVAGITFKAMIEAAANAQFNK